MTRTQKQIAAIVAIALFVGFFLWGRSAEAAEARLGIGFGITANKGATYQEMMVTTDDLRWYGAATRMGGDDRHDYQTWRITTGYRVNWREGHKIEPFMRLGVAYFTEQPTDYISDNWAFDMAVGIRLWDIVEVEFDQHNSTGGRSSQNEGLDAPMVSVVLPFGRL